MQSIARALDIFGALKALFKSQKKTVLKFKDPSLITILLGGIVTVNHPNIPCELTICAEELIGAYTFTSRHHRMID